MRAKIVKYRRYVLLVAQECFAIRFHIFFQVMIAWFPVIAQIIFWKAVYGMRDDEIGGFDVNDTVLYWIIIRLVAETTWPWGGRLRDDIRQGGLTDYLLKPVNYQMACFSINAGFMVTRWIGSLIMVAIVLAFFRGDVHLSSDVWIYPAGLLAIVLTFILRYLFQFCLGLMEFWTESYPPLLGQAHRLFGGGVVPLTFLPEVLQRLTDVLPFKYMSYFPTIVLMGKVQPASFARGIAIQILWVIALGCVTQLLWRKGLKRYVAYGD